MNKGTSEILGNLCHLITDGKHGDCNDAENSGYFFISAKDIRDGRICYEDARQIAESDFAETHRRTDLKPGDILLTNSGTIGRLAIADDIEITPKTTFQKSVAILKPKREKVLSRFLYYYLSANTTVLINAATGSAQKNLLLGELRRLPIPIPPLIAQDNIIAILKNYDELIDNNRRRINLLEDAARLIYREWFVHFRFPGHERVKITNGLPTGWDKLPLSSLCDDIREQIEPSEIEATTPYIGLEHMPRRSISLNDWGLASDVTSSKFKFQAGDILFGKIRPYFHKVGIAFVSGITSSDAIVIRTKTILHHPFVLGLVSSDEFVSIASKTVREGSKMPRADWKFLKTQEVIVPSQPILEQFNGIAVPIFEQLKTLSLDNRQLAQARDILLPRLMNGTIEIPEARTVAEKSMRGAAKVAA